MDLIASELQFEHQCDKPLLGPVVKIARQLATCRDSAVEDSPLGLLRLGGTNFGCVAFPYGLFGGETLGDVGEGEDRPTPAGHVDWCRPPRDREHRPIAADEPLVVAVHRFTSLAGPQHWALRLRIGRAVWALVVDRVMAGLAQ